MLTKKQLIALGIDNLATILMTVYESNHIFQKQFDVILKSMSSNQNENFIVVIKEVKSLVKLQQPKSPNRSAKISQKINHVRCMIMDVIFPVDQSKAVIYMLTLLSIQHKVYPAMDRKLQDLCAQKMDHVFQSAWKDFLYIYVFAPQPLSMIIDLIYQQCLNPKFLLVSDTVDLCKDILGKEGFELLRQKLEPLKFYKNHDSFWNNGGSVKDNARNVLQCVADLQSDPVAYEITTLYFDVYFDYYNTLNMAERYVQYHDGNAALRILNNFHTQRYGEPYFKELELRRKAYQLIGQDEKSLQMQNDLIIAKQL